MFDGSTAIADLLKSHSLFSLYSSESANVTFLAAMIKFFSKIKGIYNILDRYSPALSITFLLSIFACPAAIALARVSPVSPPPTLFLAKTYEGFQDEVDGCDFSALEGWFYWYIDTSGTCNTVMVANEEEAIRKSYEILDTSFSVVKSGYGANLGN